LFPSFRAFHNRSVKHLSINLYVSSGDDTQKIPGKSQ
jgi:hypothetical protein